MSEQNPYATPQAQNVAPNLHQSALSHLPFKTVKKHYNNSRTASALVFLLCLSSLATWMVASGDSLLASFKPILICFLCFYIAAAVGLFLRATWGRVLGIIACIIMLISIPIGTIIGIFGLVALFGSPDIFGQNRITHKALKTEFKTRKRLGLKH